MKEADKLWTKKKLEFLKENYNTMSLPALKRHLGISVYLIKKKAEELECNPKTKKSASAWTDKELELLKEHYPTMGTECVKYLPNRTESAIRMAASLNKIASNYNSGTWTDEELDILKENYPKIGPECENLLPNRTLKTIQAKASLLGIKYMKAKTVESLWSDEEIELLKKYYPIMGSKCIEKFPTRYDEDGNELPPRSSGSVIAMAYRMKDKKQNNWTDEELEILKTEYPKDGLDCKDLLPYKSKRSIQIKVKELKLKKDESYDHWTEKEIKLLKKAYPKMGKQCIDLFPNRTSDAVIAKAARLDLKTKNKDENDTSK